MQNYLYWPIKATVPFLRKLWRGTLSLPRAAARQKRPRKRVSPESAWLGCISLSKRELQVPPKHRGFAPLSRLGNGQSPEALGVPSDWRCSWKTQNHGFALNWQKRHYNRT